MTIDELLFLLSATEQKNLTPAQELVLRQSWENKTYTSMAAISIYEIGYLKTTASRLWQVISQLFNLTITKANFRASIEKLPLTEQHRRLIEQFSRAQPPAIFLEYPSGPVPLGSIFYVERPSIEEQAYQEIVKPGSIVRIKAPKEMGKTSLLFRLLEQAANWGYNVVNLDLQQVDARILINLDKFLRWFCIIVSRNLNITPKLDAYWDEEIGSKVSCTVYFKSYLLQNIDSPLVLALNELELILEYPELAQEFFPLLRSWYEEAKQVEIWQKLRLLVIYSTEIYLPLKLNQSPFNIGLPLKLPEFNKEQIITLAKRHGINWKNGNQAKQLIELVGGHPALVRIALYYLSCQEVTFKELLQEAATETGIYRAHLRRHLLTLQANPPLAEAFKQVILSEDPVFLPPLLAYQLESMGLVKFNNNEVRISYQLYRLYFRQQFLPSQNSETSIDKLKEENQELTRLCHLDDLTQLANRRCFEEYLKQEWELAEPVTPLSLIFCDLDFFKIYNDVYGHQAGDECLKQVANVIRKLLKRPSDLVARYGGEEFALILPRTDATGAMKVAEKIQQAVKTLMITQAPNHIGLPSLLTVSIGVACTIKAEVEDYTLLVQAAGEAMCQSKQQGRDRISLSSTLNFRLNRLL